MAGMETIRTDVVGSLLRPQALLDARAALESGAIDAETFKGVEDRAVAAAVRMQEDLGLDVVTDGEFRRLNFQDSFGACVLGFDASPSKLEAYDARVAGASPLRRWDIPDLEKKGTAIAHRLPVVHRLRLGRNLPLEEFTYASSVASKPVKVSLIGPDRISQRFAHESSKDVYESVEAFMADVVALQRQMIQALIEAGCRYVHIDAPGLTAYVDEASMAKMRERGEDPARNLERSLRAEAAITAGFEQAVFGIHLCRGNQRSMWHREGAYDAIAERMFHELPHRRFLLEYDSPRAGGFAPLRFVPKGKIVVLGLVSTKTAELESVDALVRRIEEAAKFLPLEQLAISPQCGFASDVVGNLISADDQKRKLERVVETARKVWGSS
ncbi:MAG TPA: hypothetical protein VND97_01495 [Beijerinckiaceae bacterium]|nr:hypothetical protein [Beijerinckiaceae bacterium]